MKTIVASQIDESTVVDDAFRLTFADDGSLHSSVKHLARSAADGLESGDVATQDSRQVLMHHEARPDETAMTQHHPEQPDDPRRHRFVGEDHMELGEVDLRLLTRRRLETNFETLAGWRPYIAEKIRDGAVTAGITPIAEATDRSMPRRRGDSAATSTSPCSLISGSIVQL